MTSDRLPSLARFAAMSDPFVDRELLLKRLLQADTESRYVEWKLSCPIGPNVTKRTKYRIVKALTSFANTDGGFVICGVDPAGRWIGLDENNLAHVDQAKLVELLGGVVEPDIPQINYIRIEHRHKKFIIIHTPPSDVMPHVTKKAVTDNREDGKKKDLIAPRVVYCRFGAKCDKATAHCYQCIIRKRTELLRDELLRRVKEVEIPVPVPSKARKHVAGGTLHIARLTDDPNAPAVRLTRNKSESAGVLIHEELSEGLFNEINNVLEANKLLGGDQQRFFMKEEVYYRVYAERQHVTGDSDLYKLLAHTAMNDLYAPGLYWLQHLSDSEVAEVVVSLYKNPKKPKVYAFLRLAALLGRHFMDWLYTEWQKRWHEHAQKPDCFWTLQKMVNRKNVAAPALVALRTNPSTRFAIPGGNYQYTYGDLCSSPDEATKLLSEFCMSVFKGVAEFKSPSRQLDVLTYAPVIAKRSVAMSRRIKELVANRV